MVAAIICILIGIGIAGFIIMAFEPDGIDIWIISALFGGIIGAAVTVLTLVLTVLIVGNLVPHHITYVHKDLAVLQDNSQISGSFFLGSGYIDGEMKYSYYTKTANGGFQGNSVSQDGITIYQDTTKPYLIQKDDCRTNFDWLVECFTFQDVTEFHVPAGSVKTNYTLDAK